jgi:hypothetical protein
VAKGEHLTPAQKLRKIPAALSTEIDDSGAVFTGAKVVRGDGAIKSGAFNAAFLA